MDLVFDIHAWMALSPRSTGQKTVATLGNRVVEYYASQVGV